MPSSFTGDEFGRRPPENVWILLTHSPSVKSQTKDPLFSLFFRKRSGDETKLFRQLKPFFFIAYTFLPLNFKTKGLFAVKVQLFPFCHAFLCFSKLVYCKSFNEISGLEFVGSHYLRGLLFILWSICSFDLWVYFDYWGERDSLFQLENEQNTGTVLFEWVERPFIPSTASIKRFFVRTGFILRSNTYSENQARSEGFKMKCVGLKWECKKCAH